MDIGEALAESGIGVGVWGDVTKRMLAATEMEVKIWEEAYKELWAKYTETPSGPWYIEHTEYGWDVLWDDLKTKVRFTAGASGLANEVEAIAVRDALNRIADL